MPVYAVIGATGKVGFATCSALREAGASVRSIVRDESRTDALRSIDCEIAVADLRDSVALARAIEGAEHVQVILPLPLGAEDPVEEMHARMEAIASALEYSHPRRILALSDYGAHIDHDIGLPSVFHRFEHRLGRLRGEKVFLRSSEHMENWTRSIPNAMASGVLSTFHDSVSRQFPYIAASDLGSIAAQLLLLPLHGDGVKVVHGEGPRRYSAEDVATSLSELLNRRIDVQPIPRAEWQDVLGRSGNPELAVLLARTNDGKNADGMVEIELETSEVRRGSTELGEVLRDFLGTSGRK